MKERYLYFGRFDPMHEGHLFIIDYLLASGYDVTVGIKRDISVNELLELKRMLDEIYGENKLRIILMGWWNHIAYGRKVGYSWKRIPTPKRLEQISATKIRAELNGL